MKKLTIALLSLFSLLVVNTTFATDYIVRTDGGTSAQCNGLTDAAYIASPSNSPNCAWNHPFYATKWFADALNGGGGPQGSTTFAGGDRLIVKSGSYKMGYDPIWTGCDAGYSYGCAAQPIPSGTVNNPTKIVGCSVNGCSSSSQYPELWGSGRAMYVLSLVGSSNVVLESLNVTDHGICGIGHSSYGIGSSTACSVGASGLAAYDGIIGWNWSNITLKNVLIHGMAGAGLKAGRGSNITLNGTLIYKNAFAGWDADVCSNVGGVQCRSGELCLTNSANSAGMTGSINIINGSKIVFNGCVESYPVTGTPESPTGIASSGCYNENNSGYGDGIGTCDSSGTWLIQDSMISHNTSDGLDLLYVGRGLYNDSSSSVTIRRSVFEGNVGNNIKVPNDVYMEDSHNIGNCNYMLGKSWTMVPSCRTSGNTTALNFHPGDTASPKFISNTNVTISDIVYEVGPDSTGGNCASVPMYSYNNIYLGGTNYPKGGSERPTIMYIDLPGSCPVTYVSNSDVCYQMKDDTTKCLTSSNSVIADPLFSGTIQQGPNGIGGTYYNGFEYYKEFGLQAGSPARNRADETISALDDDLDFNGYDRNTGTVGWDSGALEYGSVVTPTCNNNNIKEGAEQCDGTDLGTATCADLGAGYTGTVTCTSCALNYAACNPPPQEVCGNGSIGGGEQCDDGNTVDGDCCSSICTTETSGLERFLQTSRWTETDASNLITKQTHALVISNMARNTNTHMRYDGGASHFGNFTHTFKVDLTSCAAPNGTCFAFPYVLSNNAYSSAAGATEGLYLYLYQSDSGSGGAYIWGFGDAATATEQTYTDTAPPSTRYAIITRTGTTATFRLYQDSNYTTPVSPLITVSTASSLSYRYLSFPMSYNDANTDAAWNFTLSNLNIGESSLSCGGPAQPSSLQSYSIVF